MDGDGAGRMIGILLRKEQMILYVMYMNYGLHTCCHIHRIYRT